ncbi:MAG TPA: cupin domain-containing protein [Rhizomicrobium sp.]|nr:cupin domain-containing protein [Rhizomicrobium sp.]
MDAIRRFDDYRWDDVDLLQYKEEGSAPFKAITRQVLFHNPALKCELRYFEMAAGGYSTLERHEHMHAVLILRGSGEVLIGDDVKKVSTNDLVTVDPMTWHQFRAGADAPMGFLCMVNAERDRPQLPTDDELKAMKANPAVAAFLKSG